MDSITLALMMSILAARKYPIVALFLGIAVGMQHFEQGFFAFGAVLFALLYSRHINILAAFSVRWSTCAFIGVLLGKIILVLLFRHLGIHITDRRYYVHRYYEMFLQMFYYHTQYILWSFLGAGWFAVAKLAERGRAARPFFISLVGLMVLQLTVGDETRVFWIVSFPLIAVYLLLDVGFLQFIGSNVTSWVFGVWLLAPFPYSWGGRPLISILPYNIQLLLHRWVGWFSVPPNQSMWPLT